MENLTGGNTLPIKIIAGLPIKEQLEKEKIYTIDLSRAMSQDIRPIRVLIVNLMPKKEETEMQLLRLLGNSPLQVDIDFMHMSTHKSKNTDQSYLKKYYNTFNEIRDNFYDGMIVTGAPVEHLEYNDVTYHDELSVLITWADTHVFSRLFICYGAQFALYHKYNIKKEALPEKLFGVYSYLNEQNTHPFMRGFDDSYNVCQSRHTTIDIKTLRENKNLDVLSRHKLYGADIVASKDNRDLYIFGHVEYDRETLSNEYQRDVKRDHRNVSIPENYFIDNDPNTRPQFIWKSSGHLLFNNWLNHTYQETPYVLSELKKI